MSRNHLDMIGMKKVNIKIDHGGSFNVCMPAKLETMATLLCRTKPPQIMIPVTIEA